MLRLFFVYAILPGMAQAFFCLPGSAQDTASLSFVESGSSLSPQLFSAISEKAGAAARRLDGAADRYWAKLQRQEHLLQKKLYKKDSALARQLFTHIDRGFSSLKSMVPPAGKYAVAYSGYLDSLSTLIAFFKASGNATPGMPESLQRLQTLQGKLNSADALKKYLEKRRGLLRQELGRLEMAKSLKRYHKRVYYYGAQVKEYREAFETPSKAERKLLQAALNVPAFRDFFARHSQLGSLFALQGSASGGAVTGTGLQTRVALEQSIRERFGAGAGMGSITGENTRAGQAQLLSLKNKAAAAVNGATGKGEEGGGPSFTPNRQKTKPFLRRLEYSANLQSRRADHYFPAATDIGLSAGYKLNDNGIMGVGCSYRLGLGRGWNHIALSHQGAGLRSFADYRLKGSFFLSAGYELHYRTPVTGPDQLKHFNAWQRSGLAGVNKRYPVTKKIKGSMQLLWDFLSYRQVPKTQAVVFRVGYGWK